MNKIIILGLILLISSVKGSIVTLQTSPSTFSDFKLQFGREYCSQEQEDFRQEIFNLHINHLSLSNCEDCGLTQFMDRTADQIDELLGTYVDSTPISNFGVLPTCYSWTSTNSLPPRNLESQAPSWAYAALAFFQGQYLRQNPTIQKPLNFSLKFFQQCGRQCSNSGSYINKAISVGLQFGVPLESRFPYQEEDYPNLCQFNGSNTRFTSNVTWLYNNTANIPGSALLNSFLNSPTIAALRVEQIIYNRRRRTAVAFMTSPPTPKSDIFPEQLTEYIYATNSWLGAGQRAALVGYAGYLNTIGSGTLATQTTTTTSCSIGLQAFTLNR